MPRRDSNPLMTPLNAPSGCVRRQHLEDAPSSSCRRSVVLRAVHTCYRSISIRSALAKKGRRVVGPRACQKRQAGGWAARLPKKAGGWLDPIVVQLPPTSPLARSFPLEERERERERERAWYTQFFFVNTSPCARSSAKISHRIVISSIGSHVLLVSPCN